MSDNIISYFPIYFAFPKDKLKDYIINDSNRQHLFINHEFKDYLVNFSSFDNLFAYAKDKLKVNKNNLVYIKCFMPNGSDYHRWIIESALACFDNNRDRLGFHLKIEEIYERIEL